MAMVQIEPGDDEVAPRLGIVVPRDDSKSGVVNNKRERYDFKFRHIFDGKVSQEDIFNVVANPVIDSVLDGYNGTIFAYGQTGSGKTFTITGGAERYSDRGLIPRTLTYIFEQFASRSERVYEAKVSYLEIYNESGFDLLDPDHEITKMEDLPKVELLDTGGGDVVLRNLSQNAVNSEEDALNALFIGDTNRMIAETPMNQASTRSHCIFTIYLTSRAPGAASMRRSKLHIVDLAGSERIGKTGVVGNLATEAKYINLSLHYLEQVIVALSDKSRTHVPYRNSMMTCVLKDSLGGNCRTTMIATLSVRKSDIDESISTCRFAQRVALIQNTATRNEETDPAVAIANLKAEVGRLKTELALARGHGGTDTPDEPLSPEEHLRCRQMVDTFLASSDPGASIVTGDIRKIEACFRILKELAMGGDATATSAPRAIQHRQSPQAARGSQVTHERVAAEVADLKEMLLQRDNEIEILISRLERERAKAPSSTVKVAPVPEPSGVTERRPQSAAGKHRAALNEHAKYTSPTTTAARAAPTLAAAERAELLEDFKQVHPDSKMLISNKAKLKQLYAQAKSLGADLNSCRGNINTLKAQIERCRLEAGARQLSDGVSAPALGEADAILRHDLETEKTQYKAQLAELKGLKREIEHLQRLLEQGKTRLQRDFEAWLQDRVAPSADTGGLGEGAAPLSTFDGETLRAHDETGSIPASRKAWGTPPRVSPQQASHSSVQLQTHRLPDAPALGGAEDDIDAFFRARDALKRA